MTQKDIDMIDKILDGESVGYAYVYTDGNRCSESFVFDMTPENITNFISKHQTGVEKIVLTDMLDRLILNTIGGVIDNCPNQELCKNVIPLLSLIQTGEGQPEKFPIVTKAVYDEYCIWEDQMVTLAEISML